MPTTISSTTDGRRSAGTKPSTRGTAKPTRATSANPANDVAGIVPPKLCDRWTGGAWMFWDCLRRELARAREPAHEPQARQFRRREDVAILAVALAQCMQDLELAPAERSHVSVGRRVCDHRSSPPE